MQTLEQKLRAEKTPTPKGKLRNVGKWSIGFWKAPDYWAKYEAETVERTIMGIKYVVKDDDQMWQFFFFKYLLIIALVEPNETN